MKNIHTLTHKKPRKCWLDESRGFSFAMGDMSSGVSYAPAGISAHVPQVAYLWMFCLVIITNGLQ